MAANVLKMFLYVSLRSRTYINELTLWSDSDENFYVSLQNFSSLYQNFSRDSWTFSLSLLVIAGFAFFIKELDYIFILKSIFNQILYKIVNVPNNNVNECARMKKKVFHSVTFCKTLSILYVSSDKFNKNGSIFFLITLSLFKYTWFINRPFVTFAPPHRTRIRLVKRQVPLSDDDTYTRCTMSRRCWNNVFIFIREDFYGEDRM